MIVIWNILDRKLWELHESGYEHYESCTNLLELLYDSDVKNIYDSCTNLLELLYESDMKYFGWKIFLVVWKIFMKVVRNWLEYLYEKRNEWQ